MKDNHWGPMDKNIGKFTEDFMTERKHGNAETREALDDACKEKGLSRVYETHEELFEELDK
jgi:hypothetical protein